MDAASFVFLEEEEGAGWAGRQAQYRPQPVVRGGGLVSFSLPG